ncbi:Protein of unknown function [Lactobacillus helveticus CIRM-BIA 101]|uniref:Uncharacterized protein n=3 Tax=Lactobacillus helveticus TaxID=1587 RepID=U4QML1_LACHE|nr:Protein of unknown function [Lactobacillus helveticus CIRM-BIA 953]CDI63176.1 Protein of unknown function [Lactobacillus helveticus CIRM-BIA 103]CDI64841.1 Protein of unknown function [Lactobacillus helveticus CIRM-BIA 101]
MRQWLIILVALIGT